MQEKGGEGPPPLAATDETQARRGAAFHQRRIHALPGKNHDQHGSPDGGDAPARSRPGPAGCRLPRGGRGGFLTVERQFIADPGGRQRFGLEGEGAWRFHRHPAGFAHGEDHQPVLVGFPQRGILTHRHPVFRFELLRFRVQYRSGSTGSGPRQSFARAARWSSAAAARRITSEKWPSPSSTVSSAPGILPVNSRTEASGMFRSSPPCQ